MLSARHGRPCGRAEGRGNQIPAFLYTTIGIFSSLDGCRSHRAPIRRGMHCNHNQFKRPPLATH